jgi:ribosome maturation factor RimP
LAWKHTLAQDYRRDLGLAKSVATVTPGGGKPSLCVPAETRYIEVGRVETLKWAQAHFFIGIYASSAGDTNRMAKAAGVEKIEAITRSVAELQGIEVVEVELKGGGKNQFLRISIDKPEGVTHDDCALISHSVGEILDADETIPNHYTLEVSSPGVERKLLKLADFERFSGKRAKLVLREPMEGQKSLEGILGGVSDDKIALALDTGAAVQIPYSQVDRANLKFEW